MKMLRRLIWTFEAAYCLVSRHSWSWREAWAYAARDLVPTYYHDGYWPIEAVEVDREYWVEFK